MILLKHQDSWMYKVKIIILIEFFLNNLSL